MLAGHRWRFAIAGTAVAASLLGGCAVTSARAGVATAPSMSGRPSPNSSASAGSPSPTIAPVVSPTPVPACGAAAIDVVMVTSGVAAGTWSALVRFTNRGSTACSMRGWPTVFGVTAGGATTRARPQTGYMNGLLRPGEPTVLLPPNGRAGIDISGTDNPVEADTCPPSYRMFRITAPGSAAAKSISGFLSALDVDAPSCAGLVVSPVHPTTDFGFNQ